MLQPTPQTVMSLKASTSAMNKKKITEDWKNKIPNSTVGKSWQQNIKHANISVYKNIPTAMQTFGARATLGHIVTQSYLYKFKLSPSPLCTLCQRQEETLERIGTDCPIQLPGYTQDERWSKGNIKRQHILDKSRASL